MRERNPWSDREDGAHETESPPASACGNAWSNSDANCGHGYQGEGSRSDETDVASRSDDVQGRTYRQAVDRLLGTETASYSDAYAASGEGYKGAVAQLEAEEAEREREAQLEAETAEPQPRTNSYDTTDLLLSIVSIFATSLP